MLLIANAYLMNPSTQDEGYYDILIDQNRICKVEADLYEKLTKGDIFNKEEMQVIDATGLIAAPGLVDVHSHFRDPGFTHKEDIISGAKAAARGGYTTVVLMANTKPVVDNEETLRYVLNKGKVTGIHIETCANVTMGMKGEELVPMTALFEKGAAGFTDDGVPLLSEELVRKAMTEAKKLDVPISFHEENPVYIVNNGINNGEASTFFHIEGSDRKAEIDLVKRDLELALEIGVCMNVQHISTKEAVDLVRQAKARGGNIHAEATPHHFTLTEKALIQYGTLAKINPPLRDEDDRLAIIEGLRDGTIDLIATDHAPHSKDDKDKPITEASSGMIGLETALSLGITQLVETGNLTMMSLLEKMTCNPARMYCLDAGYVAESGPADLVLFDPKEDLVVKDFVSKSSNSPFVGWQLRGAVKYTICNGKIVYSKKGSSHAEAKGKSKGEVPE